MLTVRLCMAVDARTLSPHLLPGYWMQLPELEDSEEGQYNVK